MMRPPLTELDILGFKDSEKKILLAIHKMAKSIAMIARHTGVPRTSLLYILENLEGRGFVRKIKVEKRVFWRTQERAWRKGTFL